MNVCFNMIMNSIYSCNCLYNKFTEANAESFWSQQGPTFNEPDSSTTNCNSPTCLLFSASRSGFSGLQQCAWVCFVIFCILNLFHTRYFKIVQVLVEYTRHMYGNKWTIFLMRSSSSLDNSFHASRLNSIMDGKWLPASAMCGGTSLNPRFIDSASFGDDRSLQNKLIDRRMKSWYHLMLAHVRSIT